MQSEFIPYEFGANNMYCGKSWEELFELAKQPKTVILITPPYDTFSRARHKRPGPPPLRSEQWPRGFPWLKDSSLQRVNLANHFIDQCLKATIFAAEAGSFFLWEAPEHFGRTADGNVPSPFGLGPRSLIAFHAARPLPLHITCASSGLKPRNLRVTFATCLSLCIRRGPTWACPLLMPTIATWGRCRLLAACAPPREHGEVDIC